MFSECDLIKLSTTKSEEYTQEYRVPISGDVVSQTSGATNKMFGDQLDIVPGTTYYLINSCSIV